MYEVIFKCIIQGSYTNPIIVTCVDMEDVIKQSRAYKQQGYEMQVIKLIEG